MAQAVRTATSTSALNRQEGANQKTSPKCYAQKGNRHSHSSRSQNNKISDSSTASSIHDGSGRGEVSHEHGLIGLGSQFSSVVSVSTPRPVLDDVENVNSKPQNISAWDVQIGVEIEFLVALEKKTEGERRELGQEFDRYFISLELQQPITLINGIPARKYISHVLRDAAIPAVTGHEDVRQATARFIGPLDEYAFWTVKPKSSNMVMMPHFAVFDYVGLEFASRKLKTNVQGFQEIREALRLLRRHVLVATSSSCGAHVHVDAATLNLQERKHFLCLYILAEKELFSLMAPHRRLDNKWCEPICEASRLAEDSEDILRARGEFDEDEQPPVAMLAAMKTFVLDCASTEDLQKLISKNREPPFDRGALVLKPVGHQSYTFEFRHFQVSVDPKVIEHFICLCVALILSAKGLGKPGQPSFEETCEAFSRIQGWKELLTTIGLQNKIGFWTEFLSTYPVAGSSRSEQGKPSSFFAPLDW